MGPFRGPTLFLSLPLPPRALSPRFIRARKDENNSGPKGHALFSSIIVLLMRLRERGALGSEWIRSRITIILLNEKKKNERRALARSDKRSEFLFTTYFI